ncbi:cell surface protein SprA [Chryseobacterium sp. FH1]|uniref:T9SS outer membrane translocon Sov/SprA n=1 Tax=Chryseobacterium sp. FH1 TaxID=1233951 RepID=UPI0004E36872|nr:cell surface protein SprA [Chryseobacterium sp. FH1]KFC18045.1 gliding motility protein [Chryseobacterium sp. FH1]
MKKNIYLYKLALLFLVFIGFTNVFAQEKPADSLVSVRKDFSLADPIRYDAFYDIGTGMYYLYPKVGNTVVGSPIAMTFEEYKEYVMTNNLRAYYEEKSLLNDLGRRKDQTDAKKKGLLPAITIKNKMFENVFGGNKIELIPQGFASFDLGGLYQKIDNPLVLPQNRTSFAINIQQRIQLGITGKVGENLQLKANYDTQSGFAFENRMNMVWQQKGTWKDLMNKGLNEKGNDPEDKIIKRVEVGNINMPLSTSLIRGSESLFGLKTEFQLGKTTGTLVFSQQQGEAKTIVAQGGGTMNTFKVNAYDYEDNQHFFLGKYFLDNYDTALANYPLISSRVNITRLEVWVMDQGGANLETQKPIVGIRDLGEQDGSIPNNTNQGLYGAISSTLGSDRISVSPPELLTGNNFPGNPQAYRNGEEFVSATKARRLTSSEFKYNTQLGYVSLNQRLNDGQLLAVSYSYTLNGSNQVYKVGEFAEENAVVITKLLRSNSIVTPGPTSPMWELMMKNIYSLNTSQIQPQDFLLNVYYRDPNSGGKVNYLPGAQYTDGRLPDTNLLRVFNWDRLNINNDEQVNAQGERGDGVFDFVNGITVDAENGKLIFTKAKPFGSYLDGILANADKSKYVFNDIYDKQKNPQSDVPLRYTIEGRYKGVQGQGISLGAINVPQGSVKVTANGAQLVEGVDYTVDYMTGTVNIINETVKQSGQAINISLENQLTFNTQRKSFWGLNLERKFNEHLMVGATVVNYTERPLTQKVNYGQEAVSNTMAGFNMMYNNELPFLTRLTDKIPFVNTEAPSNLNFKAEGAYLIPGQSNGINDQSYIDDFEQTTSKISLKEPAMWSIASRPEKNLNDVIFPMNIENNNLRNGFGRGLLSWYTIDPRFYGVGGGAPNGINAQALSNHASRRVEMRELFNSRDYVAGEQTILNTFDITYYPEQRGPYNVNPSTEPLSNRWAGLMRPISVTNFVTSNIDYVEFWMMDPRADGNTLGPDPKLLLHLGNVSEDVLKDGKLQYENGLPTGTTPTNTSTTNWGVQPSQFPILYAFSTEGDERAQQDLGYDGMNGTQEQERFGVDFVNPVTNELDPASDNFVFYMSDQFQGDLASSLTERYRYFRNPEGNSAANSMEVASQTPDAEDVNRDYNLDLTENYNQYTIDLSETSMVLGSNKIVDVKEVDAKFENGQTRKVKWFLFRIPVAQYDGVGTGDVVEGSSQSVLNNVRYARLLMKGFDQTSTLRFGTFDLVRSDWRKYANQISSPAVDDEEEGSPPTAQDINSNFDVGSVNLEENGRGTPPYVLPPGIDRQVLSGNAGAQRQNESSLYMKVDKLSGEARGVFKNTSLDMRRYKKLQMFVHAQNIDQPNITKDPNAKFFIRFGSDAVDNYYEYEASLNYTSQNATSPLDIWPSENEVNLEIENFVNAKLKRDELIRSGGQNIAERYLFRDYGDDEADKKIYVKGRPSIGNVTTIMIGVRNNAPNALTNSKTLVLWVNEIRLSEIENKGGYAGNASLNFNLGDFAMVNANASYASVGFGAIDQKPSERSQDENSAFSINTTVNVDKFLPEKVGMKIPVNYSYTQTMTNPKYNPLDNDIELTKAPNEAELKKVVSTYTQQRSIGVVNMRKDRMNPNKKPKFYDVENLNVTAIYNDDFYRDVYTTRNYRQYLKGYVEYNYTFKPYVLKPFNKMVSDTAKSYKYLRWIKEVNFNPVPTRLSFRTILDRNYNELEYRNVDALLSGNVGEDFETIRNRNFFFGWQYSLGFNFTKSLKLEINSETKTLNDQIDVNSMNNKSIFGNPFRAGRPVLYNHRAQLNYRLPFEYFPYLDFINAEASYQFQYNWNARSTAVRNFINPETNQPENLGNISQNTNAITATSTMDIPKFFGKFNYFKKINETMQKRRQEIDSLNNVYNTAFTKKNSRFKFKSYKFKNKLTPIQAIAYALTSFKQLDFNYNESNGIILPGLLSAPNFYGVGQTLGGPTIGFLLGSQADIRRTVIENGWVSGSNLMNDAYSELNNRTFTGNLQVMPANDLRIDFNVMQNYSRNYLQGGYNVVGNVFNPDYRGYRDAFATEMITYSNTAWSFNTSFKDGAAIYQSIKENALAISQQYNGVRDADGYTAGYSRSNAYVLIPAFQSAIEGKSPKRMGNPTKAGIPLPNWKLVYSGLRNLPIVNSQFSKFDILHSYVSTFTMSGIQSSIDYYNRTPEDLNSYYDSNGNRYNPYTFTQVGYVESFYPLVGFDVTMRNNMQFRFNYNRDRTYILGLVNTTLTEEQGNEFVVGYGYILKDLKIRLNYQGKSRDVKSDLNIRADLSMRDSKTTITNILIDDSQITGGQKIFSLKLSADYNMSQNLNLKFFYDQMMTKYKISTAFPLSTLRAGITATLTFGGTGN